MQNKLGIEKPFMFELVPVVGEIMKDFYPEVTEKQDFIQRVIKNEEERFHETLHDGVAILAEVIEEQRSKRRTVIPGADAFTSIRHIWFPN